MDVPDDVLRYYGSGKELDRLEVVRGLIEAERTKELVARFLPEGASVLDVGGGPGYYAEWLAGLGHAVHLLDPVPLHVEDARRRAGEPPAFTAEIGDARAMPIADAAWDAVLLFGPLYHLTERTDRLASWREAHRVVRPGGVVLAAAISRFAPALDGVRAGWISDDHSFETVRMQTEHGWRNDGAPTGFPSAYFHDPDELAVEAAESGLTVGDVYGVEGPGWLLGDFEEKWADPVMRERLLWLARSVETDPRLRAASAHLLLAANRDLAS